MREKTLNFCQKSLAKKAEQDYTLLWTGAKGFGFFAEKYC